MSRPFVRCGLGKLAHTHRTTSRRTRRHRPRHGTYARSHKTRPRTALGKENRDKPRRSRRHRPLWAQTIGRTPPASLVLRAISERNGDSAFDGEWGVTPTLAGCWCNRGATSNGVGNHVAPRALDGVDGCCCWQRRGSPEAGDCCLRRRRALQPTTPSRLGAAACALECGRSLSFYSPSCLKNLPGRESGKERSRPSCTLPPRRPVWRRPAKKL